MFGGLCLFEVIHFPCGIVQGYVLVSKVVRGGGTSSQLPASHINDYFFTKGCAGSGICTTFEGWEFIPRESPHPTRVCNNGGRQSAPCEEDLQEKCLVDDVSLEVPIVMEADAGTDRVLIIRNVELPGQSVFGF